MSVRTIGLAALGVALSLSCGQEGARNSDFGTSQDASFFQPNPPPAPVCTCQQGFCCGNLCCGNQDVCCSSNGIAMCVGGNMGSCSAAGLGGPP